MKTNFYPLFLVSIVVLIITNIILYNDLQKQLALNQETNKGITFIWNDDEESIPVDGSLIQLEFTDEDTVYIGPVK